MKQPSLGIGLLVLLSCGPFTGESRLIGSSQPIVAVVGSDIILPSYLDPPADVTDLTLEWSRPDLRAEPGHSLNRKYVHLQRDGLEMLAMKHPTYYGRTALFKDALKDGNVSLKLTNVMLSDQGVYRCFIPKLESPAKESVVQLVIVASPQNTASSHTTQQPDYEDETRDEDPNSKGISVILSTVVSVVVLVVVAGVIVYLVKKKLREKLESDTLSCPKEKKTLVPSPV